MIRRPAQIIDGKVSYLCRGPCGAFLPAEKFHRLGSAQSICDRRSRCIKCEQLIAMRKYEARHLALTPARRERGR